MDAVAQRLATGFIKCPIVEPNGLAEPPTNGGAFLIVEYPIANEEQITIGKPGANLYRETGAIRFVLEVPQGRGLSLYLGWIDELRDLFRGRVFSGIYTWHASPAVTADESDSSGYFRLSFSVPYTYDITA